MKDIKPKADFAADPTAWSAEWRAEFNAAMVSLVEDGKAGRLWTQKGDLSRDDTDDEQIRWLFWRQYKSEEDRCRADRDKTPDAYLYEGVRACMEAARRDERHRIAAAIGAGLKALLGDEFTSIMYDIALQEDINIGYD